MHNYTRRDVAFILGDWVSQDVDTQIDVRTALLRLRERHRGILSLVAKGWTVNEAAKELGIQKPYRFHKAALRSLVRVMNGGKR